MKRMSSQTKIMQFMLPAEHDSLEKIPKPTDSRVKVKEIPSAVGAVHRFSGSFDEGPARKKAAALTEQLRQDKIIDLSESDAGRRHQV
jgi:hypothetical protein